MTDAPVLHGNGPAPGRPPLVTVGIVTWNSAHVIDACLRGVRAQTLASIELRILDNASTDGTREALERLTAPDERSCSSKNLGFSRAHNQLIARSRAAFYLCLNPDVTLEPTYVATLVAAVTEAPEAGSATGKLVRVTPPGVIDSTGLVMTSTQRHLDRGADELDQGQFDTAGEVFGPSGAAALYRRAMLDDVHVLGEYFDEDFFAYREDADLAWRARLFGWKSLYVPSARATHVRRVTPDRRGWLPSDINRHSVRNRFLLRLKNQPLGHAARFLVPSLIRDLQVIGYVLLVEHSSLPALADVLRLLPRTLRKRRAIMRRRRLSSQELARWFVRPLGAP